MYLIRITQTKKQASKLEKRHYIKNVKNVIFIADTVSELNGSKNA